MIALEIVLFGGHSGTKNPFVMDNNGSVSYVGSALKKEVKVSPSLYVQQNVAGNELFNNISDGAEKTSIFQLVDDFIFSLENDLNSGYSSNLLSDSGSVDLVFPSSGAEADFEFVLKTGNTENKIEATIYGNDYSQIVDQINDLNRQHWYFCFDSKRNKIRLEGSVEQLNITNLSASNFVSEKSYIGVIKDISSSDVVERINDNDYKVVQ